MCVLLADDSGTLRTIIRRSFMFDTVNGLQVDAIQAGMSDYLVKPFTTEMLEQKLARLVSQFPGTGRPAPEIR